MSELHHQLYGGEISDYILSKKYSERQYEDPQQSDQNIGDIYESQIKGQKSIDTSGIYGNHSIRPAFERDPMSEKLEQQLQQTLQTIADQLGTTNNSEEKINKAINVKDQTSSDIDQANDNVLRAMKELIELKAI